VDAVVGASGVGGARGAMPIVVWAKYIGEVIDGDNGVRVKVTARMHEHPL